MKKLIILSTLAMIVVMLSSCGKTPINGKLDGMWQLIQIDNAEGSNHEIKDKRVYYSIQLELISLRGMSGSKYILGRFEHTGDSLFLYDLRSDGEQPSSLDDLKPYGLTTTEPRFGVEELTGKAMILKSEDTKLYFRKF